MNVSEFDVQYKALLQRLVDRYDETLRIGSDRTGVGTVKVVGSQIRIDLTRGFPQLNLKRTVWKDMIRELKWFLIGSTDNEVLEAMGCKFWSPWAVTEKDLVDYYVKRMVSPLRRRIRDVLKDRGLVLTTAVGVPLEGLVGWTSFHSKELDKIVYLHPDYNKIFLDLLIEEGIAPEDCRKHLGQLGKIYGGTWTKWSDVRIVPENDPIPNGFNDMGFSDEGSEGARVIGRTINQIEEMIKTLRDRPSSRRIIVSAWDPRHLPDETMSPQDNVIEGRAALAYCHAFFQYVTEELTYNERCKVADERIRAGDLSPDAILLGEPGQARFCSHESLDASGIPRHRLSCVSTVRKHNCALAA